MFVHNLTPITALGGNTAQVDTHGAVTCAEVPDVALASYAARLGSEAKAQATLKKELGGNAPKVGKSTIGTISAFWTAPDQWLVEASMDTHEELALTLAETAKDVASVTEQTDAWTRFDVSGNGVLAVMELLCAANTSAMQTGDATRSAIHHLGCFVLRRNTDTFSIYGPRASAVSLHHAIVTAMHSAL